LPTEDRRRQTVDEFRDVDAAHLRVVPLLAAPEDPCLSSVMIISR
jgi:hypothetical protein